LKNGRTKYNKHGLKSIFNGFRRQIKYNSWFEKFSYFVSIFRQFYYRLKYGRSFPDHYTLLYVDPEDISLMVLPPFHKRISRYGNHVRSGSWDISLEDTEVFYYRHRFENRFLTSLDNFYFHNDVLDYLSGTDWEDTEVYDFLVSEHSEDFALEEKNRIDSLVESIKEKGYLSRKELEAKGFKSSRFPCPTQAEVEVNIGRNGEIVFEDGKHRLCVAKYLGIDLIPVRVLVRHHKWIGLRKEVFNASSAEELSENAIDVLDHPDMNDIVSEELLEEL